MEASLTRRLEWPVACSHCHWQAMGSRRGSTIATLVRVAVIAACMAVEFTRLTAVTQAPADPFAFFRPWLQVSDAEHARLASGGIVVRTLPAEDGEVAVFAAARLQASADALVGWTRSIEELKRSPQVIAVRRFSNPPSLEDLSALTIDDGDLEAIRKCQPGRCEVKLTAGEITALRDVIAGAGAAWKPSAQNEFRRLMLKRVELYRGEGLAALPAYADRPKTVHPRDAFAALVARSPYLTRALPEFAASLAQVGVPSADTVESLLYWSKERFSVGKNVISMTHVQILRPEGDQSMPKVLVAGKQIFATHYTNAGFSLTTVLCPSEADTCYLAYLNRSRLDVLGGVFGGLRRAVLEQRIESDSPAIVRELRRRLESGNLPGSPSAAH